MELRPVYRNPTGLSILSRKPRKVVVGDSMILAAWIVPAREGERKSRTRRVHVAQAHRRSL